MPTRQVRRAGLLLGVGLAALLDGIVFHELLGWHHLLSARVDDLALNLRADGAFHVAAFLVALAGIALLWKARHAEGGRTLVGALVVGGALFNVAETLVDHFLLRLHWLHPSADPRWDLAFLALNVLLAAGAWRWMGAPRPRRASREAPPRTRGTPPSRRA